MLKTAQVVCSRPRQIGNGRNATYNCRVIMIRMIGRFLISSARRQRQNLMWRHKWKIPSIPPTRGLMLYKGTAKKFKNSQSWCPRTLGGRLQLPTQLNRTSTWGRKQSTIAFLPFCLHNSTFFDLNRRILLDMARLKIQLLMCSSWETPCRNNRTPTALVKSHTQPIAWGQTTVTTSHVIQTVSGASVRTRPQSQICKVLPCLGSRLGLAETRSQKCICKSWDDNWCVSRNLFPKCRTRKLWASPKNSGADVMTLNACPL